MCWLQGSAFSVCSLAVNACCPSAGNVQDLIPVKKEKGCEVGVEKDSHTKGQAGCEDHRNLLNGAPVLESVYCINLRRDWEGPKLFSCDWELNLAPTALIGRVG
jgi:hypothetical protein